MIIISEKDLVIPQNRQRRNFPEGPLSELAKGIAEVGLLQPIVLRNDGRTLLVGERRVRAMQLLHRQQVDFQCQGEYIPMGHFPAILAAELSEVDLEEAELQENILREDLTWQERAAATARLHELRVKQNGEYSPSNPGGQTLSKTAAEILGGLAAGYPVSVVSNDIRIAKHLDDPEVATAKTKKEAEKIIRRKAEAEHRAKLAETFQLSGGEKEHRIECGDCRELSSTIESGSVAVLLTDPPYGEGADTFGDMADTRHEYEDSHEYFLEISRWLAEEASRICRASAHSYVFCSPEGWYVLRDLFSAREWKVFPAPLIWYKGNAGMLPWPDHGPRRTYECVMYAIRGGRKTVKPGVHDVIDHITGVSRPSFGAQKPPELYRELLARSANPGDTVWDPFAGTGPLLPAAKKQMCKAILFERSREKVDFILAGGESLEETVPLYQELMQ